MKSRNKIILSSSACLFVIIYFTAPFVIVPAMFKKNQSPSILSNVWNIGFSNMITSLSEDNWYKIKFKAMTKDLCDKHKDRCKTTEEEPHAQ